MRMNIDVNIGDVLFFDVQSVVQKKDFNLLSLEQKLLFQNNVASNLKEDQSINEVYQNAGNWAEFSKVICISVGYIVIKSTSRQLRIMNFTGEEKQILEGFSLLVESHFNDIEKVLCGCDIQNQWIGFLQRRMLVHNIGIPEKFGQIKRTKNYIDPIGLWSFGNERHHITLSLIAYTLGVRMPLADQYAFNVHSSFYLNDDLNKIVSYSQLSVYLQVQVLLRFMNQRVLEPAEVSIK